MLSHIIFAEAKSTYFSHSRSHSKRCRPNLLLLFVHLTVRLQSLGCLTVRALPQENLQDGEERDLLPVRRIESHLKDFSGQLVARQVGIYTIVLDNTFSRSVVGRCDWLAACVTWLLSGVVRLLSAELRSIVTCLLKQSGHAICSELTHLPRRWSIHIFPLSETPLRHTAQHLYTFESVSRVRALSKIIQP